MLELCFDIISISKATAVTQTQMLIIWVTGF